MLCFFSTHPYSVSVSLSLSQKAIWCTGSLRRPSRSEGPRTDFALSASAVDDEEDAAAAAKKAAMKAAARKATRKAAAAKEKAATTAAASSAPAVDEEEDAVDEEEDAVENKAATSDEITRALLRKFGLPIDEAAHCVADLPQLGAGDIPKHSKKVSKDKHQVSWTRDGLAETEVSFQKRVREQ